MIEVWWWWWWARYGLTDDTTMEDWTSFARSALEDGHHLADKNRPQDLVCKMMNKIAQRLAERCRPLNPFATNVSSLRDFA